MGSLPPAGTLIEISLPNGRCAYGLVYKDAGLAIYRDTSDECGQPRDTSTEYRFIVGAETALYSDRRVRSSAASG
jgi:hypothetical protein